MDAKNGLLDLYSTSETSLKTCIYGAPLVAIMYGGQAYIKQACCNHWTCPKCGETRARQEYNRIVRGAEKLESEGYTLYFVTLTCRGRECSLEEAEEEYYTWTHRLLANFRLHIKRNNPEQYWAYAQITERQERLHPHSHIITTFKPEDSIETMTRKNRRVIVSDWFYSANVTAMLGVQHEITKIESAAAASRYVAKYMFKASMKQEFPAKWKRVRYSQNYPKLEAMEKPAYVQVLRTPSDWRSAYRTRIRFECENEEIFALAAHRIDNISLATTRGK